MDGMNDISQPDWQDSGIGIGPISFAIEIIVGLMVVVAFVIYLHRRK